MSGGDLKVFVLTINPESIMLCVADMLISH